MKRRFIQDYRKKDGKELFEYVGDYYIFKMDKAEKRKHTIYHILYAVLHLLLLLAAGFLNSPGSYKIYIVLPYLCMVLPLLYYLMGAAAFAKAPEKMEREQYEKSLFRMMKSVIAVFFLSIFIIGMDGIFLVTFQEEAGKRAETIFFGIMFVLAVMNYFALVYHNKQQKQVMIEKQQEKMEK